ncbi:MAG: alanine racemase [Pseudomonadota bacterium]
MSEPGDLSAPDGLASAEPAEASDRSATQRMIDAPAQARAVLRIDLAALRDNWATLNATARDAVCAGVVKADAYGLGLEPIAQALSDEGCATFFVATLEEGERLRTLQPSATIYVLDGLLPGAETHYAGFNLRPVLSSRAEVVDWSTFCAATGQRRPAAVHIETGMNRLGIPENDLMALVAQEETFARFQLALIMSHFACADEPDHPLTAQQRATFERLRAMMPEAPASLANSGGVFHGPAYHYDLVRPGIALYGGRAIEERPNPMRTVVELYARILQVRTVMAGETIGYGASYVAKSDMRVATIACGYADGFLRALSAGTDDPAPVGFIGAYPVPVVGRVSMDLITLDVSAVPADLAQRGAWVEVLGAKVNLDDLTDRAGTIGYELLSRLGRRVHRIYVERGEA